MAITSMNRSFVGSPSVVNIECSDSLSTVLGSTYLADQADVINELNKGAFNWVEGDVALIDYDGGRGFFTHDLSTGKLNSAVNGNSAGQYADGASSGAMPILFVADTAGGATATTTIEVSQKIAIVDAWVTLNAAGTASDTVQIKNPSGDAITDAMDISGSDQAVVRASTIETPTSIIFPGLDIEIVQTDGGGDDSPACRVCVLAYAIE